MTIPPREAVREQTAAHPTVGKQPLGTAVARLTNDLAQGWISNSATADAILVVLLALSASEARAQKAEGELERMREALTKIANGGLGPFGNRPDSVARQALLPSEPEGEG